MFRPGIDSLADGEALEYSADAYVMYHTMSAEWPCLSLDVVPDMLGTGRSKVRRCLLMLPRPSLMLLHTAVPTVLLLCGRNSS